MQQTNVRSGLYSVKASGMINSSALANYNYKIAETKIAVKPNMKFSFWKKTENDLGRFVFVDLITKNGKNLRDNGYKDQNGISMNPSISHGTTGSGWEKFTCQFGNGILLGDTITGIVVSYDHSGSGSYLAYFDDFLIEDGQVTSAIQIPLEQNENNIPVYPNPSNGRFNLKMNTTSEYQITVYDSLGNLLVNKKSNDTNEIIELSGYADGIYILRTIANKTASFHKLIKTNKKF